MHTFLSEGVVSDTSFPRSWVRIRQNLEVPGNTDVRLG